MLGKPGRIISHHDLESKINTFSKALNKAYGLTCPIVRQKRKSKHPWWNGELGFQRRYLQEIFKLAKVAGREECWTEYTDMLKIYKRAIRTAKRRSWRSFCSDIEKIADVARLRSVLSKQPTIPCLIKSEPGHWADSNLGSLNLLLETHFSGCSEVDNIEPGRTMVDATDSGIVTRRKLEWAVGSFEQYKSSGPDGIFPAMLQKAVHLIIPWLKKIFKECLRLNYVHLATKKKPHYKFNTTFGFSSSRFPKCYSIRFNFNFGSPRDCFLHSLYNFGRVSC